MSSSRITTISTLLPEYSYSHDRQIEAYKKWVSSKSTSFQQRALKIFDTVSIKNKHIIAPIEVIFSKRSFEESNNLYVQKAVELGTECLKNALSKANLDPKDIDYLITTSCTGFMIPSFDAFVINNLGLKDQVKRLPITELGCCAGASALIYASDFLKAYPDKKVAVITLEFPSNTIRLDDLSIENIVGTALFSDGVSCSILETKGSGPKIIDTEMYHMNGSTDILGYNLTNQGLRMNLSKKLPNIIKENFEEVASNFLNKNNLEIKDIDDFLIHPGGVKIIDNIEGVLAKYDKNLSDSRYIMKQYGNMSSSTILFILDRYLNKSPTGKNVYVLSFGPGLSAHQLLLKT